jgi:hypothetical protein
MAEETVTEHKLQNKWVIWCHELHDNNWDISSYKKLYEFDTIEKFWGAFNTLLPCLSKSLLFIMKDGIMPVWEDEQNVNGCSISMLSTKSNIYWRELCIGLISNDFVQNDNEINGISSCPKYNKVLFKMWMKNCTDPVLHGSYTMINLKSSKKKIYTNDSSFSH